MNIRTSLALACAFAVAVAGAFGCANYRLGTTLPKHLKTIYIPTFKNQTTEPAIESKITSAVRRDFQRDGNLRVVDSEAEADIRLKATLLAYDVESLLYERNSPNTTRRYKARLVCLLDAEEVATGKKIVTRQVTGETTFPAAGDTVTARRNALNDVARSLSREVVDAVIGAW